MKQIKQEKLFNIYLDFIFEENEEIVSAYLDEDKETLEVNYIDTQDETCNVYIASLDEERLKKYQQYTK